MPTENDGVLSSAAPNPGEAEELDYHLIEVVQAGNVTFEESILQSLQALDRGKLARLLRWLMLEDTTLKILTAPLLRLPPRLDPEELQTPLLDHTPPTSHCSSGCVWPTGQSLLIQDASSLKRLYGLRGFLQEGSAMLEKIWTFYLTSFLIQDFYYYYRYPGERFGDTPLKILTSQSSYQILLAKSLTSPVVWPVLFGVPLIRGLVTAYQRVRSTKDSDVTHLIQRLQTQFAIESRGIWKDSLSWLMPFKRAATTLEAALQTINWDGRLSPEDRLAVYQVLDQLARDSYQLAQWYVVSALAEIAYSVDTRDFERLHHVGLSDESQAALVTIRTQAYQTLHNLARFSSTEDPENHPASRLRQYPRYLVAQYSLWCLGHPDSWGLQPFFLGFKALRFYIKVRLLITILQGIHEYWHERQLQKHCENRGYQWLFREDGSRFVCSACGNAPIPWRFLKEAQACADEFLRSKHSIKELTQFFQALDLRPITSLDLSQQVKMIVGSDFSVEIEPGLYQQLLPRILQARQLHTVTFSPTLIIAKEDKGNIHEVLIVHPIDLFAMENFLVNASLSTADLSYMILTDENRVAYCQLLQKIYYTPLISLTLDYTQLDDNAVTCLAKGLQGSTLAELSLMGTNATTPGGIALGQALPASKLKLLNVSGTPLRRDGIAGLLQGVPGSLLKKLYLNSTDAGSSISVLVAYLSTITSLDISDNNTPDSSLATFAKGLVNSPVNSLLLDGNDFGLQAAIAFSQYLNQTQLHTFKVSINDTISAALAPGFFGSTVKELSFFGGYLGDKGLQALALDLASVKLDLLDLSENQIGDNGVCALAQALSKTLTALLLRSNVLGDVGTACLAAALPSSNLQTLDLSVNLIALIGAAALGNYLNQSSVINLDLSDNFLGSEGVVALAPGLPGSRVKQLDLSGNVIGPEGGWALGDALPQSAIQILLLGKFTGSELEGNLLGDVGIQGLARGFPHSHLETLFLDGNKIGPAGGIALGQSLPSSNIVILFLQFNSLHSTGLNGLAQGLPHSKIVNLVLENNDIGAENAHWGEDIQHSSILELDLSANPLQDSGVTYLASYLPDSQLQILGLIDVQVGNYGIEVLAQHLIRLSSRRYAPWIYTLDPSKTIGIRQYRATTNISKLFLETAETRYANNITAQGREAVCKVYGYTELEIVYFFYSALIGGVSPLTCTPSPANRLQPGGPYVEAYRLGRWVYDTYLQPPVRHAFLYLTETQDASVPLSKPQPRVARVLTPESPCHYGDGRTNILETHDDQPALIPSCQLPRIAEKAHELAWTNTALQALGMGFLVTGLPALLQDVLHLHKGWSTERAHFAATALQVSMLLAVTPSWLFFTVSQGLVLTLQHALRFTGVPETTAARISSAFLITAQLGISFSTNPFVALQFAIALVSSYLGADIAERLEQALVNYLLKTQAPEVPEPSLAQSNASHEQTAGFFHRWQQSLTRLYYSASPWPAFSHKESVSRALPNAVCCMKH